MTKELNLRLPPAHRRACLALYRALLKALSRPSFPDNLTKNIPIISSEIPKQFRRDRKLTARNDITSALARGRALHTLLSSVTTTSSPSDASAATKRLEALVNAAVAARSVVPKSVHHTGNAAEGTAGTETSTTTPTTSTPSATLRPPHPSKLKKIAHLENYRSKYWAQRIPNPIPVLQRPVPRESLPDPDRPRKVPSLIVAQGIPFLRYKSGPQSPVLSRILRQYNKRDQRRWDRLAQFTDDIGLAEAEDKWDEIVDDLVQKQNRDGEGEAQPQQKQKQQYMRKEQHIGRYGQRSFVGRRDSDGTGWTFGVDGVNASITAGGGEGRRDGKEVSWATELKNQTKMIQKTISSVSVKRRDMGEKMWNIVVQEKKLAEEEKTQRREQWRRAKENDNSLTGQAQLPVAASGEPNFSNTV